MNRFSSERWEAARRRVVDQAFQRVPYYREQWAVAGRVLEEPVPVASADLTTHLFRLFPLGRPWLPGRAPSPWLGEPAMLASALREAGVLSRVVPVLEVRREVVDWRALGRLGPRYAALLPPGADVVEEEQRRLLNLPAVQLATIANRVVVVGTSEDLAEVVPALPKTASLLQVVRRTAAQIVGDDTTPAAGRRPAVRLAHDPCLGDFAATAPSCGRPHVLWRRYHAGSRDGALLITALRRRPVLCSVVPEDSAGVTVGRCPEHGTAILTGG